MLRALKNQLNQLANDRQDHFAEKVWACLGDGKHSEESTALKNFVLLLPDMISQVRIWAEDEKVPVHIKRLHGFVLTYLYNPLDLLPEEPYGLFGYLDDAYLIGEVYHRTMMYAKSGLELGTADREFSSKIGGWLEITRKVIPHETQILDQLVEELVKGNDKAFHDLVAQTESTNTVKVA